MGNDEKIKKWLAGELSDHERKEFEDSAEYRKISRMMNALQSFKAPAYDAEQEYSDFYNKVIQAPKKKSIVRSLSPLLKIAALVIFIVLTRVFSYLYFEETKSSSEWITEQHIVLPDSSLVFVNAASQIKYSEKNWDKNRLVELQGEAFFKVKKGSRFKVKTAQGLVSVLGTQFVVNDRDNFYEVTCYEGKVEVVAGNNRSVLKANSVFRIVNEKEEKLHLSNTPEPTWLSGESSFKSVPLRFVFEELERQYNITVNHSNVNLNQRFTGSFVHKNLNIALESITFPVNLDFKIIGNNVEISAEGK